MSKNHCALCDREAELRRSHVFPEFFYSETYDETHRHVAITRDHPEPRFAQVGLREWLLCGGCETAIGRYESYASSLFRRHLRDVSGPGVTRIEQFDYDTLKLFSLSLLWRMHVANNVMFRAVNLGPRAQVLKAMLRSSSAGEPHEFGFALARIDGVAAARTMVVGPSRLNYQGRAAYNFIALGMRWVFIASRVEARFGERFPFVGSEPTLIIPSITESQHEFYAWIRKILPKAGG